MARYVEDLVNQALVIIGRPERISDIREGGAAATAALEVYQQTRDELLDAGSWPLATRDAALTLWKGPPPNGGFNFATPWTTRYPEPGWLYSYLYPDDMLDLRAILPRPGLMFNLRPRPATWRVGNDNSLVTSAGAVTTQKKVILTNIPSAIAVYIGQVVDPALWEPGFTSVVIDTLAKKLSRRLGAGEAVERETTAETEADWYEAESARG